MLEAGGLGVTASPGWCWVSGASKSVQFMQDHTSYSSKEGGERTVLHFLYLLIGPHRSTEHVACEGDRRCHVRKHMSECLCVFVDRHMHKRGYTRCKGRMTASCNEVYILI